MRRPFPLRLIALGLPAFLAVAGPGRAHVTPNIELVSRAGFIRNALPDASRFFERHLDLDRQELARIREKTGWTPTADDVRIYVGRDADGTLVGSVVFLWQSSQHGPLGLAVAFAPDATVRRATVTDVGTEPLNWVRPLLDAGTIDGLDGLRADQEPDPAAIAPAARGAMSRYYAEVIARGVERARAVEKATRP